MASLKDLQEEVMTCKGCDLHKGRTNVVFGDGDENSKIMFVGEAPGYYEDRKGKPFVGQAGELLSELLSGIGLRREEVYITNVLKCRPPGNRNPRAEEIDACKPILKKQIEIINPLIICTLGNFATQVVLGRKVNITGVHGQPLEGQNFFVFPILHPAAALHNPSLLDPLKDDFRKLKEFLDSNPVPRGGGQMSLF
jgi:DNA polymerase